MPTAGECGCGEGRRGGYIRVGIGRILAGDTFIRLEWWNNRANKCSRRHCTQANLNCDIATTFDRFGPIVAAAKMAGIKVRGYISCVTDCPFDGQVAPASVADVAAKLHAMGEHRSPFGAAGGAWSLECLCEGLHRA